MKPDKIKLAAQAVIGSAVIYDLVQAFRMKRAAKELCESNTALHQLTDTLIDANKDLADELERAQNRCEYLARIIDENHIPLSEFDQIVYLNLIDLA